MVLVLAACADEETQAPITTPTLITPVQPTSLPRPQPTPTPTAPTTRPASTPETNRPPRPLPIVDVPHPSCPADGHTSESTAKVAPLTGAAAASSAPETRIIIDGFGEDWAGRPVLLDDPAGNAEPGILDLTKGYAFVNEHALYRLVEADDPDAVIKEFQVELQLGTRRLHAIWAPQWSVGYIAEVTGQWERVGDAVNSFFAFGLALEARIDLRDLGSPDDVKLIGVGVRAGGCCEQGVWRIADRWEPFGRIPVVNESDPAWRLAPRGGARESERLLSAPDTRVITLKYDTRTM